MDNAHNSSWAKWEEEINNICRVESTDNAHNSSWPKWPDEIDNITKTERPSHGQCDALTSDSNNGICSVYDGVFQKKLEHSGLKVGGCSKEKIKGIYDPRSSESSMNTNLPESYTDSAPSNIDLDKMKGIVFAEDNTEIAAYSSSSNANLWSSLCESSGVASMNLEKFQIDDDIAKIDQIESDEILACQLQEQYNKDVAGAMLTNETTTNISHLTASKTGTDQIESREEPMSEIYTYYRQLPSRISLASSSIPAHLQSSNLSRSFQSSETEMRLLAELRNYSSMGSERRREIVNELESALYQSNEDDYEAALYQSNEDDYEAALYQSNEDYEAAFKQRNGASESQIESLPQCVIKGGTIEEKCAICLEVPSSGDKIRHLPCFHKFHLQCIDFWLRRNASCPVCKSKIS